MEKVLTISKLDASKRQLETVIRLYFSLGDPVSIHTLTSAAYNILRDINKNRGGKPLIIKEQIIGYIKPEYQKEIRIKINEAENFFKHADQDHDAVIRFYPDQSELLLLEACSVYSTLTGEMPPLFKVYTTWYMSHHTDLYTFTEDVKRDMKKLLPSVLSMNREEFFNVMLPIALAIRI
ncbi:MAG: hypothetical protein LUQ65_04045 [Candidatus Helarchaeota archaeon]|nr:hypothetical protein [Candidatus Helarchaeota archaeon]